MADMFMTGSLVTGAANVILSLALLLVYGQVYRHAHSSFALALLLFAGAFLAPNALVVYSYATMMPLAPAAGRAGRGGPGALRRMGGPVRGHALPLLPRAPVCERLPGGPGLPGVQREDRGRQLRGRREDHPERQPPRPHPVPGLLPLLRGVVRRRDPRGTRGDPAPEARGPRARREARPPVRRRGAAGRERRRRRRRARGPHGRLDLGAHGLRGHRVR